MAVQSIFWDSGAGNDYHLIPGVVSPRLDHLLWIADSGGNVRADSPPGGVMVVFAVNAPLPAWLRVDGLTGEVTVTGPLPAPPRLLDFLVVATVTEGATTFKAYVRVHVHEAIRRMWLTPDQLTTRIGAGNMRFTVLAEFDDGSYGDLTNWAPWDPLAAGDETYVHVDGTNTPILAWRMPPPIGPVTVDSSTGRITCGGLATALRIEVTATLPAPHGPALAAGTVYGAPPWSNPVPLTLISGPGFGHMASVPNILILPDGFETGEQAAFEDLADDLVAELHRGQRTIPFNLLKDRMNYFRAWVTSVEGAIPPLGAVAVSTVGADTFAQEVDTAVPASAVATTFTVGTPPASPATILLNERDTAFHCVLGERPRAMRFHEQRGAHPSDRRFDEEDFDDFLGALADPAGVSAGAHWQRGGKDSSLIVVLCRSSRYGGANNSRAGGSVICMSAGVLHRHRIVAAGLGRDVSPEPPPAKIEIELRTRTAHELAHSFPCGDEYGGGGELPAAREPELDVYGNLQARSALLTGGSLDADKIKWRWPRIEKAGVLTGFPIPAGARHRLPLEAGHAAAFAPGDIVRLRLRPLLTAGDPSYRLEVKAVNDPELEVEQAEPPAGPAISLWYGPGSIVFAAKRAPDPAGGLGDDLELVHAGVRAWMNAPTQKNPLNAAPGAPANRPCPGPVAEYPTPATTYPPGSVPRPPKFSEWLVGLFEGGRGFDCGLYHPTGACIMGTQHMYVDAVTLDEHAYQFCPVCRYVMVDQIAPTVHGEIDRLFEPRYPR